MEPIDLRKQLRNYIEIGDKEFLELLYETAESYIEQNHYDLMIKEGEEDIKQGKIHSQDEVQQMIEEWTKETNT